MTEAVKAILNLIILLSSNPDLCHLAVEKASEVLIRILSAPALKDTSEKPDLYTLEKEIEEKKQKKKTENLFNLEECKEQKTEALC